MIKGIYDLHTRVLTVSGTDIKTFTRVMDEPNEIDCLLGMDNKPLYDIQLGFEYDYSENEESTTNSEKEYLRYSLSVVNLVTDDAGEIWQGNDYQQTKLVIIDTENEFKICGIIKNN